MRFRVFFVILHIVTLIETRNPLSLKEYELTEPLDSVQVVKRANNKKLKDLRNQDYHEMYREMMNFHHGPIEDAIDEEFRLRRIVGQDNFEILKESTDRWRSSQIRSVLGKRRARSQALRREKLNSQSLRSHLEHIRQSREDSLDSTEGT